MLCLSFSGLAHTTNNDSVKAQQLNEVVVEAQMQNLASAVSAYYPDGNQKKFCLKVAACSDPICL